MAGGGKESKRRRQLIRSGVDPEVATKQAADEFAGVRQKQAAIEAASRTRNETDEKKREREKRKREQKEKEAAELAAARGKEFKKNKKKAEAKEAVEALAIMDDGASKKKERKREAAEMVIVPKSNKVVFSDDEEEGQQDSEPRLKKKKKEKKAATAVEEEAEEVAEPKKKKKKAKLAEPLPESADEVSQPRLQKKKASALDEAEEMQLALPSSQDKSIKDFVVFVGQLPFDVGADSVKSHFLDNGISRCSVRMLTDKKTQKSRGMAFVTLYNEEDVEAALALHRSELNGLWINVERSGKTSKKQNGDAADGNKVVDKHLSVFVAQLPFKADEDSVRKYFEEGGVKGIVGVRMLSEKGTNKKGMAFVRLSDETGVQAAVELNESQFDNRWIRVERSSKHEAKHRAEEETQAELYADA